MADLEMPQAYREEVRRARLVHTCESCRLPIMRDEPYAYCSGVWDGYANDYKRHLLCALLEALLSRACRRADYSDGLPLGDLVWGSHETGEDVAREVEENLPAWWWPAWESVTGQQREVAHA